ncbi:ribonuclease [Novosphingobium fuchskuhlense]|uniref:Ribonuclease n=1 Tax=Novosphingobium fuchskuhlense TaxID=1117702 RepID=A0A117USR7_9SPHN|nr:ribonuclease [Novosphingobium fuchskuhlense]KUR70167.1 ribonuclease [Novosphingobium fuchskuhlense]
MPEWLIEQGIGEDRAVLVDAGEIVAARVVWDEPWRVGAIAEARLVSRIPGTRRAVVRLPDGTEALGEGFDPALTEGRPVMVRVTRSAIAEKGRTKLPQVRPAAREEPRPAPSLQEELAAGPCPVRSVPIHGTAFAEAGWDDLVAEALTGEVSFAGGSLVISPTPAMTLIDIDGPPPLPALALAAVPAAVQALLRLDIAGSVGIDFPSLAEKAQRQAIDAALAAALAGAGAGTGWQGERTGMNGFGFVQLVSRLERPSLVARFARSPAAAAARRLLRQGERVAQPGVLLLTAHPAVRRAMRADWEAELTRRTGRRIQWHEDAALAPSATFAQAIAV